MAAVGGLLILAAPAERAQALSLANPGAAAAVQQDSERPPRCIGLGIITAIIVGITVITGIIVGITIIAIITTTVDFRAVPPGPLAKRDDPKKQAPDRRLFCIRSQSGRCGTQLQFLNFQDLSFHGVSVSMRHCSHRSGGHLLRREVSLTTGASTRAA